MLRTMADMEEVAGGHTIGRVTPRRDDRWPDRVRGASPRQEGPVSLPDDERACGVLMVFKKEVEHRSTPRNTDLASA